MKRGPLSDFGEELARRRASESATEAGAAETAAYYAGWALELVALAALLTGVLMLGFAGWRTATGSADPWLFADGLLRLFAAMAASRVATMAFEYSGVEP